MCIYKQWLLKTILQKRKLHKEETRVIQDTPRPLSHGIGEIRLNMRGMLKDCVMLENCTRIYCCLENRCTYSKEILSLSLYSWLIAVMSLSKAN